eukprot:SAG31_NODE_10914_length_1084_cov_1.793909_3_plen_85_part_00
MCDALIPAMQVLQEDTAGKSAIGLLRRMLSAAETGARSTATLIADLGRSAYVPAEHQKGVADPGASAIVMIIEAVVCSLVQLDS